MSARLLLVLCIGLVLSLPVAASGDVTLEGELIQVTDESYPEYHPRIDGDIVVFTAFTDGSENIVYVDVASGERRQITSGATDQRLQDVSGRRVAYTDYSGSLPEVFVYDLDVEAAAPVTDEDGGRDWPSIDEEKVAYVHTALDGVTSIWVTDVAAGLTIPITADTGAERRPSIEGSFVAFERMIDGDSVVILHDMRDGSETILSAEASNQRRPHIDGDRVVFDAFVDGREVRDLVVYEISTGTASYLLAEGHQSYARISGDWIGFDDDSAGPSDIGLLHLPTGFTHRITDPENTDYFNDIDGNRVVFTSNAAGKFDIWMFEFEADIPGDDDEDEPPIDELPGVGEGLLECAWNELPALGDPFFEAAMVRDTGAPVIESHSFEGDGVAIVTIDNDRCAAGWAKLNGEPLLLPHHLDYEISCLWGAVELQGMNTLLLSAASKPGCSITVAFYPLPQGEGDDQGGGPPDIDLPPPIACETGSGATWLAAAMVVLGMLVVLRRPLLLPVVRRSGRRRS